MLCAAVDPEQAVRDTWKMVAFLGRYGRQDAGITLNMPLRDLGRLASEVAEMMREENDSFKQEDR